MARKDYEIIDDTGISIYVAPWALPKEDIPIHIKWPPNTPVSLVYVKVPRDFEVKEVLNTERYEIKEVNGNKVIKVFDVKKTSFSDAPLYFGLVVSLNKIPNEIMYIGRIVAEFLDSKGKMLRQLTVYARVFRPIIEVLKYPETVEIHDGKVTKIPLHLKYAGFGDVTLEIEVTIGGKIISQGEAIVLEIIRRLSEKSDHEKKYEDFRSRIRIQPAYVRNLAKKVREYLVGHAPLPEFLRKENIEEIRKELLELEKQGKLMEFLYAQIHNLLIDLLIDLLERYPIDTVELTNPYINILTKIETPINEIILVLKYKDAIGNEYKRSVGIKARDLRGVKRGKHPIELIINVEKWNSDPLRNVESLIVGDKQ